MIKSINNPITEKIARIRYGEPVRILDLFAGCGGLSLGFDCAGCEIIGAVEIDSFSAASHGMNFFKDASKDVIELHSCVRDITKTSPQQLIREIAPEKSVEHAADILIGGPPCQAFARIGRSKLREIAEHPQAFLMDDRAKLYLHYLEYIRQFKPVAILMENVPDVLNYGGHNIAEEMCTVLSNLGYTCGYTLLNAVYYGVPQMRERMFLIAYANEFEADVVFPEPTHWIELPSGYSGARQVALRTIQTDKYSRKVFYLEPPEAQPSLIQAVSAREAIGDLAPITLHLEGKLKRGIKKFNTLVPYGNCKMTAYSRLMRYWRKFENHEGVKDHVIRLLPRDYPIFQAMAPGDQYPEAYILAWKMFDNRLQELAAKGEIIEEGTARYETLKKKMVPPYDPDKFPNKWRKMEPDLPARTLMAHLGKDGYSHIHYDSKQARTISVREAARLQSFPDGFVFAGAMNQAFKQIGNAVPPLMAYALARQMLSIMGAQQSKERAWRCETIL